MTLSGWLADVADLALPAGCVSCGGWVPRGAALACARCRSRLRPPPWPRCARCGHPRGTGRPEAAACLHCAAWPAALASAHAAFVLETPASDFVHALKYEGWVELAVPMAESMARIAPGEHVLRAVVPVPTTRARVEERGYNQAEVLARALGRRLGLPVSSAMKRVGARRSQTSLRPDERRENVRGVFRHRPAAVGRLTGKAVLLIDDVLTTGATACEAASTLVSAGVGPVSLLTYARALPSRPRGRES